MGFTERGRTPRCVRTQRGYTLAYMARPTTLEAAFDAVMDKRGDAQADAAKAIGADQQAISKWRSGKHWPSAKYLPKVGEYLGLTPAELEELRPPRVAQRTNSTRRIAALEERVDRLTERIELVVERQERLGANVDRLRDGLDALRQSVDRLLSERQPSL